MFKKILLAAVFGVFGGSALFGDQQARGDDYVRGYTRSNGIYVAPYYRTHADHNFDNNWSTYPNVNPYTGQMGTRVTPPYSSGTNFPSYSAPSYLVPSYHYSPSVSPGYGLRK